MSPVAGECPTRRDLFAYARQTAGSTLAIAALGSLAVPLASTGCAPSPVPLAQPGGAPPRLPVGSPDFDILNSLLQLEIREIAIASEAIAGNRLDPREAGLVSTIRAQHNDHVADLRSIITSSGGQPGEARERYVLPTPMGDQRRALEILLSNEGVLVDTYKRAVGSLSVPGLTPRVESMLFSDATHVAALASRLGNQLQIQAFA